MTIHIVEDDPGVSDSLLVLLRNMDRDAVAYPDAESFFRTDPPGPTDMIIVDLLLPGISGMGVIRWLQRLAEPPKIVAITGQSQAAINAQLGGERLPNLIRKPNLSREIANYV